MNTMSGLTAANAARLDKSLNKRVQVIGHGITTVAALMRRCDIAYRACLIDEDGESYGFILNRDAEYGRDKHAADGYVDGGMDYMTTDIYGMAKLCFDHLTELPVAVVWHEFWTIETPGDEL
ncbi:hypothetical protein ABZX73_17185 [Brevibacterium casei]